MRTPSLRRRVVVAGVFVVAIVLGLIDAFLYLNLRTNLQENLEDVLNDRVEIVRAEAAQRDPQALADRLTQLGLGASIRAPDGRMYVATPPSPALGSNLAPSGGEPEPPVITRAVPLDSGITVTVQVRRDGMDAALQRVVLLEAMGSVLGIGLATVLLARVARRALRPLDEVAGRASRVAAGEAGERLRPDRPSTEVGQVAAAHDAMLDALERVVHEARAAEAHSRLMEERTRKIIETATDAFLSIDVRGTITTWNEGARRVFGWHWDEVFGRDAFETIFPPHLRDEHRKRLERLVVTGERRGRGRRLDTLALRRDGTTFDAELVLWAAGEGPGRTINAFVHDASERRRREEAIQRLAAIVDSSDDAIIGTNLQGIVTSWNRAAERIHGYRADEMLGQSLSLLVPPERRGEVEEALQMVRSDERVLPRDTVRLRKEGPPIEVSVSVAPIRDRAGEVTGFSSTTRDLTEQRSLSSTLDSTLVALEGALAEAQSSEARSRRFLADAAHQLRTPMAGIRACAETMLRGVAPEERDRLLIDLVREASRASRLMASLLQMARIDQGDPIVRGSCDLAALCCDEVERAALLAPNLDVVAEAGSLGRQVELDPNAVREVLANLLDNARRHARHRIRLDARLVGDDVELRVHDDGPGLAPGTGDQVFERFVTLDGRGGSGLGLAIGRALAQAHGGDLVYEGGAFVLRLPACAASEAAQLSPPAS